MSHSWFLRGWMLYCNISKLTFIFESKHFKLFASSGKMKELQKFVRRKIQKWIASCLWKSLTELIPLLSEERARIYSSDSDEGSEEDKAQRLLKAKKLTSDEVKPSLFSSRALLHTHKELLAWRGAPRQLRSTTAVYTCHWTSDNCSDKTRSGPDEGLLPVWVGVGRLRGGDLSLAVEERVLACRAYCSGWACQVHGKAWEEKLATPRYQGWTRELAIIQCGRSGGVSFF